MNTNGLFASCCNDSYLKHRPGAQGSGDAHRNQVSNGAGKMVEWIRCLPRDHEDLNGFPAHVKSQAPGMLENTYNLSAGDAETGGSLELMTNQSS